MLLPRVLSAIVGIPLGVLIIWLGGPWLAGLVLLLALLGFNELHRTLRTKEIEAVREVGFPAIAALIAGTYLLNDDPNALLLFFQGVLAATVIGSLAFHIFVPVPGSKVASASATILGVMYVGFLFTFAVLVRQLAGYDDAPGAAFGFRLFLVVLFTTMAADTGAYAAGKTLGRHKLCPAVSPGKTVEGAFGGLAGAMLVAWAIGSLWAGFRVPHMLAFGAIAAVLGLIGDLSKSIIKRDIGVKDFGTLIPGHGGVLDRFDSLLVNMTAAYFLASALMR